MGMQRGYHGWIARPQALVCFVVLCLCIGALGGTLRSSSIQRVSQSFGTGHVNGASVDRLSRPDCNAKPCIALTFDDGPSEIVTPQILDILERKGVVATFFIVGRQVAGREAIVQREHRAGHEIGNHSWGHPDLTKLSPVDAEDQVNRAQQAIASAGVPAPKILRPPYGAIDNMVASHTHMTVVRWNIDPEDWRIRDSGRIHQNVVQAAHPGGIVLMHDIEQTTAQALEAIIDSLAPYYQFVTVSQLLDLSPGDPGQYFGRHR